MELLSALSTADPDLRAIDRIILDDPQLAGTILRYANSPFYRRGTEISNVPTATLLIGLKNIRSAVVMSTLGNMLPADNPAAQRIRAHHLSISLLCKLIARQCHLENADDMELLGLLHDMGMVVLVSNYPREYGQLLKRAEQGGEPIERLEFDCFGIRHGQVNARALQDFHLPERYAKLLAYFHQDNMRVFLLEEVGVENAVLTLAHLLLEDLEARHAISETLYGELEEQLDILGLDDDDLAAIKDRFKSLRDDAA
jgi:HD-like signal output (HDOD) protein